MRFVTYNKGYQTKESAHLQVAYLISTGEITDERDPKVLPYVTRDGKTKWRIMLKTRS